MADLQDQHHIKVLRVFKATFSTDFSVKFGVFKSPKYLLAAHVDRAAEVHVLCGPESVKAACVGRNPKFLHHAFELCGTVEPDSVYTRFLERSPLLPGCLREVW